MAKDQKRLRHGMYGTRTYKIWENMKSRCGNPKAHRYDRYGGRGIKVCQRWQQFENFLADMGVAPDGLTLERVHNDGHYEPGNCKWASRAEQNLNKCTNTRHEFQGEQLTVTEVAQRTGMNRNTLFSRLGQGLTLEQSVAKVKWSKPKGSKVLEGAHG